MKSKALIAIIMVIIFTLFLMFVTAMESYYRSGKLQKLLDSFGFKRSMDLEPSLQEALIINESFSQE